MRIEDLDGACPHVFGVRVEAGGWTLDPEMGLWVHGGTCGRPSRATLRDATGVWDGPGGR